MITPDSFRIFLDECLSLMEKLVPNSNITIALRVNFSVEQVSLNKESIYTNKFTFPIYSTKKIMVGKCIINTNENIEHLRPELDKILNNLGLYVSFNELKDELEKTNEILVRTSRASLLNDMTKSIGHEINNPLSAIFSCVDILEDTIDALPENHKELKALSIIKSSMERIDKVVKCLSDLNHSTLSDLKLTSHSIILQQTQILIKSKSKYRNVSLQIKDEVHYDVKIPYRTEEVLFQILANAFDASLLNTNCQPMVNLKITYVNDKICFTITDTGNGLPNELIKDMFSGFLHSKYSGKSIGLGFSVCKQILDTISGKILFIQNNPTTFEIIVPISATTPS